MTFLCTLATKWAKISSIYSNITKVGGMFRDFPAQNHTPWLGISWKKVTHFSGTPPFTILGEYPPPPPPRGGGLHRVSQKAERSIFVTLIFEIRKYSIFWFHQINIVFWKEWYPDHWNWYGSFYSIVISQNIVIVNFLFILVTFQSGIMVYWHPYIVARKPIDRCKTKRELMDCYTRRK